MMTPSSANGFASDGRSKTRTRRMLSGLDVAQNGCSSRFMSLSCRRQKTNALSVKGLWSEQYSYLFRTPTFVNFGNLVFVVHEGDGRTHFDSFCRSHPGFTEDDDLVALLEEPSGRTVEDNVPFPFFNLQDIGTPRDSV